MKRRNKTDQATRRPSTSATDDASLDVIRGLPKLNWEQLVQQEERDLLVLQVRDQIVSDSLQMVYEQYLERQTVHFTVHCSRLAFIKLMRLYFIDYDSGEPDVTRSLSWQPDGEAQPVPKDSWASQSMPVVLTDETSSSELSIRPSLCTDDSVYEIVPANVELLNITHKIDVPELHYPLYAVGDVDIKEASCTVLESEKASEETINIKLPPSQAKISSQSQITKLLEEKLSSLALRSKNTLPEMLPSTYTIKNTISAQRLSTANAVTGGVKLSPSKQMLRRKMTASVNSILDKMAENPRRMDIS